MSNEEEIIKWTRAGYRIRKRVINIEMEFANFGPSRIVELQRRGPASQRDNFLRPSSPKSAPFPVQIPFTRRILHASLYRVYYKYRDI